MIATKYQANPRRDIGITDASIIPQAQQNTHRQQCRYLNTFDETDDLKVMVHDVIGHGKTYGRVDTIYETEDETDIKTENNIMKKKMNDLLQYSLFDRFLLQTKYRIEKILSELSRENCPQSTKLCSNNKAAIGA